MGKVGCSRKLDTLGRVCIPKEYRRKLGIDYGSQLEIFCDGETIVIKKADMGLFGKLDEMKNRINSLLAEGFITLDIYDSLMEKIDSIQEILAQNDYKTTQKAVDILGTLSEIIPD